MRVLFISGTTIGGSGRSQRELAARLEARGHELLFVADDGSPRRATRFVYERLSDLSTRVDDRLWPGLVKKFEGLPGRRVSSTRIGSLEHRITPIPENAIRISLDEFEPDVVVGSSVLRLTWRKVLRLCQSRNIATVLYVREVAAMNHFTTGRSPADRVVANATSLAEEVERLGFTCAMLPSVIEVNLTEVPSDRTAALVINPIPSHGIELIWQLASRLPEVPFIVQESWPLDEGTFASLRSRSALLPNVEMRRARPPGADLYRQAKVLLVPHRIDNRPRVIAEAQANGIPVIASRVPGLVEAVGDGGVILEMNDSDGWVEEIRKCWSDADRYAKLAARAVTHSRRSEIDPESVTQRFEALLFETVATNSR